MFIQFFFISTFLDLFGGGKKNINIENFIEKGRALSEIIRVLEVHYYLFDLNYGHMSAGPHREDSCWGPGVRITLTSYRISRTVITISRRKKSNKNNNSDSFSIKLMVKY